jgi:hypothetical protein
MQLRVLRRGETRKKRRSSAKRRKGSPFFFDATLVNSAKGAAMRLIATYLVLVGYPFSKLNKIHVPHNGIWI